MKTRKDGEQYSEKRIREILSKNFEFEKVFCEKQFENAVASLVKLVKSIRQYEQSFHERV